MKLETIINKYFEFALSIKLYHWQTYTYSRHKSSDKLFSDILESMDSIVEIVIGKSRRPNFDKQLKIKVRQYDDDQIIDCINEFIIFLEDDFPKYIKSKDTDLLNLRDDILGKLNQYLYLFSLHKRA